MRFYFNFIVFLSTNLFWAFPLCFFLYTRDAVTLIDYSFQSSTYKGWIDRVSFQSQVRVNMWNQTHIWCKYKCTFGAASSVYQYNCCSYGWCAVQTPPHRTLYSWRPRIRQNIIRWTSSKSNPLFYNDFLSVYVCARPSLYVRRVCVRINKYGCPDQILLDIRVRFSTILTYMCIVKWAFYFDAMMKTWFGFK